MASLEPGAQRSGSTAPAPGRGGAVVRGPPAGAGSGRPALRCRRAEAARTGRDRGDQGGARASAWRMWAASSAGLVRALRPLVEGMT